MKKLRVNFGDYEFPIYIITDAEDAEKVLSKLLEKDQCFGLDIETFKKAKYKDHKQAGLCPHLSGIRLVQVYDGTSVYVFDLFKIKSVQKLFRFLSTKNFVAHNALFEIKHLTFNGVEKPDIGCSMLMAQMISTAETSPYDPDPEEEAMLEEEPDGLSRYRKRGHGLKDCAGKYLGFVPEKELQTSDWGASELSSEQYIYAGADAFITYELGMLLYQKITDYKMQKHYRLLKATQYVIAEMELTGFPVDWPRHQKLIDRWDEAHGQAIRDCYPYFRDANLNSSKQMGEWVAKYFKRQPEILNRWPKTPKGAYSFNATAVADFKELPPIKALLTFKEYDKLLNTYGDSLREKKHPITGRLHCSYTLGETRTGRLSSRQPNLQNCPRDKSFRDIFGLSEQGSTRLVVADFSQIELRIQAELSRDPVMRKVYKNKDDIYKVMASSLIGRPVSKISPEERQTGKVIVLGLGYGMGGPKLGKQAKDQYGITLNGKQAHSSYHATFKVYSAWCNAERKKALTLGYGRTVLGKVRRMNPDEVFTRAPNHAVQGSAAELMMASLCFLRRELPTDCRLIGTIHDELIVECPKSRQTQTIKYVEAAMSEAMEYMFPRAVTFDVAEAHSGLTWAEAKG